MMIRGRCLRRPVHGPARPSTRRKDPHARTFPARRRLWKTARNDPQSPVRAASSGVFDELSMDQPNPLIPTNGMANGNRRRHAVASITPHRTGIPAPNVEPAASKARVVVPQRTSCMKLLGKLVPSRAISSAAARKYEIGRVGTCSPEKGRDPWRVNRRYAAQHDCRRGMLGIRMPCAINTMSMPCQMPPL
jgi:hypothetical protein